MQDDDESLPLAGSSTMPSETSARLTTTGLGLVLTLPALLLAAHIGQPWRWFSLHPLLMLLAFVAAAGTGILTKIKGGRVNTLTHGYLMCSAFVLSLGGWYVIHIQKNMLGKPHLTTWHAWAGVAAILGYAFGAAGGAVVLHPDFGMAKKSQTFRSVHKLGMRAATLVAFAAIGSGWAKLAGTATTLGTAALLAALAWRARLLGKWPGAA